MLRGLHHHIDHQYAGANEVPHSSDLEDIVSKANECVAFSYAKS
jgi:hypothetical protein